MLIKHSIIYFFGKVAPALLSIVGVMIYTRLVTPVEYGLFSLVTVIAGLINIFFFQWIRSSFIRFYNDRGSIDSFMGSILKSHIITLVILGIPTIITAVIFYFKSLDIRYVFIGYILVILLSAFEMLIIYFRTKLKPTIVANVNVTKSLIVIIISTILIYLGLGSIGLFVGLSFGTFFGILLYVKKIDNNNKREFSIKSDRNTQITLLKYGLPITLSFALSVAMQNIDKVMISSILGLEANGNYAVSYDLIHNLIYMIMTSLSLASFPLILKVIKKDGEKAGKKEFANYTKLLLFISIPACFGLASIINEFTSIIIGNEYSISGNLMNLIIVASLFHGLKSHYFDLTLQISGKTSHFFIPSFIAIILNIVLNIYMLKKYGIEGAALATAVSFLIAMLISSLYSIRNYKVPIPWLDLFKTLTASFIMYLLINGISIGNDLITLLIKVFTGGIVYVIVSFIGNSIGIRKIVLNKVLKR